MVQSLPSENRPWRISLRGAFQQELQQLNQLPLTQKNAPVLIGTEMGNKGNFEMAWNLDKTVLMIWATSGTWDHIVRRIVKQNSQTSQYEVDCFQENDFLNKIQQRGTKPFLRSYPSSLFDNLLRRVEPWLDKPIQDGAFGSWVELAYLLPSYISMRFGPQGQLAGNRGQQELSFVQQYAAEAKNFFDQRGQLIGYGVGDSGLWLDCNSTYLPSRSFRLIWGLGGRSDFAIQTTDDSIEFWDLKTHATHKLISTPQNLVRQEHLQQVVRQAPMQLIYPSHGPLPFPNVLPVKTIGVLGIGCHSDGTVVSHSQTVPHLYQDGTLEYLTDLSNHQGVLNRSIQTIRLVQLDEQVKNPKRFELASEVLKKAVNRLVDALITSNEWVAIQSALDAYHQRKYG